MMPSSHPADVGRLPIVYLVDDEAVVLEALAWLLRTRRIVSERFSSAEAFEEMLATRDASWPDAPSCLVLDVRMGGDSGLMLFDRLQRAELTRVLPVVFLTGHGDVPMAVAAVQRGAFDFFEKPFSDNKLVNRIEQAFAASAQAIAQRRERHALQRALADLTEREREVMRLIVAGRPNKLIADELHISVRTVEVHRARVFEKMGVTSAVALANRLREPAS
jgi:two-component system response regulator DctR